MPISPLLASLLLAPNLIKGNMDVVLYADDGIIFSTENTVQLPILCPESGISYNLTKSRPIKSHGNWLVSNFTFLGVQYAPQSKNLDSQCYGGTLTCNTRNPKTFTLDHLEVFKESYRLSYEGLITETFDHWLHTKIGGYLLSRLYQGSYCPTELIQDFTFDYKAGSWSDIEMKRYASSPQTYRLNGQPHHVEFNIFNSSSFANQSLSR